MKLVTVNHIVDRLGLHIDEAIRYSVSALITAGYKTDASCEGHPDDSHGLNYPWIDFQGIKSQELVIERLAQFYNDRPKAEDVYLILSDLSPAFEFCRLDSSIIYREPGYTSAICPSELKKLQLEEFNDFARFCLKHPDNAQGIIKRI